MNIQKRIGFLTTLKNGWYDGKEGCALTNLQWLSDFFKLHKSLPSPRLYPTIDGNVIFEWDVNDWSIGLEFNLETKIGLFSKINLTSNYSYENQFDLTQNHEVERLIQNLKIWKLGNMDCTPH